MKWKELMKIDMKLSNDMNMNSKFPNFLCEVRLVLDVVETILNSATTKVRSLLDEKCINVIS